jgi:hypothetical protein
MPTDEILAKMQQMLLVKMGDISVLIASSEDVFVKKILMTISRRIDWNVD